MSDAYVIIARDKRNIRHKEMQQVFTNREVTQFFSRETKWLFIAYINYAIML